VYGLRKALIDQFMDRYFPRAPEAQKPATLASAPADAQKIAGRYESSRRIEHGFLSIFYLLQQATINANGDGTIDAPKAFEPGNTRYREVAPNIWREVDGTRQLALESVNGVKTVVDSENPTSVLQEVPGHRAAPFNLTVLTFARLCPDAMIQTRQHLRSMLPLGPNGVFGIMPGALGEGEVFGAKLISVFPGNFAKGIQSHQGVVVLFDGDSGAPVCIAHAGEITAIRTAAASAVATDALARPEASRLAILGYGEQATTHARAISRVRPLSQLLVCH